MYGSLYGLYSRIVTILFTPSLDADQDPRWPNLDSNGSIMNQSGIRAII